MYLRFVSPLRKRRRDLHLGIFQAAYKCRDDIDAPAWLHRQIIEEIDWFKDYLPNPAEHHFDRTYAGHLHPDAVCWFKSEAKRFIEHAWALKALIEEAGLPMSVIHTRRPGTISYQDKYQIVAHPLRRDLPRFR